MKTKRNNNQLLMTLLKGRTFIVLIVLVIFFSFASKSFLSPTTLTMVAKHVSLYGILALGMTFVIITGGIDLSVGSVVGLTGMLAGGMIQEGVTIGSKTLYFNVPAIIIIMLVFGCFVGLINVSAADSRTCVPEERPSRTWLAMKDSAIPVSRFWEAASRTFLPASLSL